MIQPSSRSVVLGLVLLAVLAGCTRGPAAPIAAYPLSGDLANTLPGGCALDAVGNVPFSLVPGLEPARTMAGPFDDQSYLLAGGCLVKALQGASAWTIKGYFMVSSFGVDPGVVEVYTDSTTTYLLQIMSNGGPRVADSVGTFADGRGGLVEPGRLYVFALSGSSAALTGWVSPADHPDQEPAAIRMTDARLRHSIASINFGRLAVAGGRTLNGYIGGITVLRAPFDHLP